MKKVFFIASFFAILMLFETFAFALQEGPLAAGDATSANVEPPKIVEKEVKKAPSLKSWVRKVGSGAYFAPGIQKKIALEQTATSFDPGQMKKAAGVTSARLFARKPGEASAIKKKIFEEAAKKVKPAKRLSKAEYKASPLKGKHIPQRIKQAGKFYK